MSEEPHDSSRTRKTVAEAARELGISESAVRQRVKRGRLKHERTPGGRLIVYLDNAATSETSSERALDESLAARTERYLRGLRIGSSISGMSSTRSGERSGRTNSSSQHSRSGSPNWRPRRRPRWSRKAGSSTPPR